MVSLGLFVWAIPSVVGIAILDHLLFKRWMKCEFCHHPKADDFVIWLLPSFLEISLFIMGFALGSQLIK